MISKVVKSFSGDPWKVSVREGPEGAIDEGSECFLENKALGFFTLRIPPEILIEATRLVLPCGAESAVRILLRQGLDPVEICERTGAGVAYVAEVQSRMETGAKA